ncbi:MAG: LTA synthase family protein [Clostridia bacterium]|nr:LTA synthase family protein [Clostridia bacterium]
MSGASSAVGKRPRFLRGERGVVRTWLIETVLIVFSAVYTEVCLHFLIFGRADDRIWFPVFFGLIVGTLEAAIASFIPKIPRRIFIGAAVSLGTFLSEIQLVYQSIFGNLMPLNLVRMGGGALANFAGQTFYAIGRNLHRILLLALPVFAVVAVFVLLRKSRREPAFAREKIIGVAAFSASVILTVSALLSGGDGPSSAYRVFSSSGVSTDTSYKTVGMTATTIQEIRYMLFGKDDDLPDLIVIDRGGDGDGDITYSSDEYNVDDRIDFRALAASCGAGQSDLYKLDRYMESAVPTKKNEYTGVFEGYNVITFCAESYSPYFLSEELTPTLWEMTHNGFVFNNYYGTFQSVTTNGEYTMCMGLYPDMTRSKTLSSFDVSIGHYLPYALGNALGEKGYLTLAYHNYLGDFYNRNATHPNMGYEFKAVGTGLDVPLSWPASDDDMIKASVGDYVNNGRPFHVYYMTFSGHYQYDWENAMSAKHRSETKDLPYSEEVKAFVACNLEVEYAMRTLLSELERAGVADRTLIVLTNDHYPYGLSEEQYSELAGFPVDVTFGKYRNDFICYVPGMEPVEVDAYCSTADILPTVLNLLGADYDSRLLAGVDVLSEGDHIAVLSDESFIADGFRYDAETGSVIPDDPDSEPDEATVDRLRAEVSNRFALSTRILNGNYYAHVFGKETDVADEAVVFEDITDIFVQNNITFLYRRGFVDAVDNRTFGVDEIAELGELLDIAYRMAGSPSPGVPVPEWCSSENTDKWDSAVAWAAENGIIRESDPELVAPDGPVSSHLVVLVIYRAAGVLGGNTENYNHDAVDWAIAENPEVDPEILRGVEFCLGNLVYVGYDGTHKGLWRPDEEENTFNRQRIANIMFKFYTVLIEKTGK